MEHQKVNQKENRQENRKEHRKEHRADRLLFRKATQADEGQVYALICDMEQKELPREAFAAIFARQLEDEHYCCLVCELDQSESGQSGQQPELAGVLNLRLEDQLHHAGRIAEIMEFAVAASCRSGGLGRLLFARACDLAREQGCTQIEVACNQLRTRTHGFYLKQGMHNFHFKFSKSLIGTDADVGENRLGR